MKDLGSAGRWAELGQGVQRVPQQGIYVPPAAMPSTFVGLPQRILFGEENKKLRGWPPCGAGSFEGGEGGPRITQDFAWRS